MAASGFRLIIFWSEIFWSERRSECIDRQTIPGGKKKKEIFE